jgi:hypothetical protein
MPAKKEEVDCAVECAALKKEVAALKKEIAALKKELKAKSSGGADPRVDKILSVLKDLPSFRTICANKNIKI